MISSVKDYLNLPYFITLDFSQSTLEDLNFQSAYLYGDATTEAMCFYFLNEVASHVMLNANNRPLTSLERRILVDEYAYFLGNSSHAYLYLWYICIREARHLPGSLKSLSKSLHPKTVELLTVVKQQSSLIYQTFIGLIQSVQLSNSVTVPLVALAKDLVFIFSQCKWPSSYGGKAWARIAECLYRFVSGVTNYETTLDTMYTLAHNTGNIFNKGMCYSGAVGLPITLDLQRAGMLGAFMSSPESYPGVAVPKESIALMSEVLEAIKKEDYIQFGEVDWDKVSELSPTNNDYKHHKSKSKTTSTNKIVTNSVQQKVQASTATMFSIPFLKGVHTSVGGSS